MCGIIGLVDPIGGVAEAAFDAARDLMCHRGPDDAGSLPVGPARFGSRRLAIIDVSPAGHQPMASDDGAVMLVFNGAIYNFQELRGELAPHSTFHSHTDSEVLLNGYLIWGWEELLRRVDGMFAFAIWDNRTGTL